MFYVKIFIQEFNINMRRFPYLRRGLAPVCRVHVAFQIHWLNSRRLLAQSMLIPQRETEVCLTALAVLTLYSLRYHPASPHIAC